MRLSYSLERAVVVVFGLIVAPLAAAAYLTAIIFILVCLMLLNYGVTSLLAGDSGVEPVNFALFFALLVMTVWISAKLLRRVGRWIDGPR